MTTLINQQADYRMQTSEMTLLFVHANGVLGDSFEDLWEQTMNALTQMN